MGHLDDNNVLIQPGFFRVGAILQVLKPGIRRHDHADARKHDKGLVDLCGRLLDRSTVRQALENSPMPQYQLRSPIVEGDAQMPLPPDQKHPGPAK